MVYQPVINDNITFTGSKHKSIRYYTKPKNSSVAPDFSMEGAQETLWLEESFAKMKKQAYLMHYVKYDFCKGIVLPELNYCNEIIF